MKRLVIIDGKSVFYRGYYAMPGLSTKDGIPTGGVFGFASLSLEIVKKLEPDYVCVAWDKKHTSIRKRLNILPTYKAGRKTPPSDFFNQIPILHDLLDAFGWPLYEFDDYEADDIMGTISLMAEQNGIETCLVTSDLDMLQLVSPLTKVYAMKRGLSNIEEYNPSILENKLGIKVSQFLDLKALKGDSSDNIPGVPGIGDKTAVALLKEFESLDNIYKNIEIIKPAWAKKLLAGKESAYISRKVGQIWRDAPVDFDLKSMDIHNLDVVKLSDQLRKLEFNSLIKRLPTAMQDENLNRGLYIPPVSETVDVSPLTSKIKLSAETVVHIIDDKIIIAPNRSKAFICDVTNASDLVFDLISTTKMICYDVKDTLHKLNALNINIVVDKVFDIKQASFLIDPLIRDRSLSSIVVGEIDESNPAVVITAIWNAYDTQMEKFKNDKILYKIATDFDFPLAPLLFKMEKRGVKINTSYLADMSHEIGKKYEELQQKIFDIAGYNFNIASPAQLSDMLFIKLQLPTTGIKKGKTGYSTGQKELNKLRGLHPVIELIEQTRELAKLKNTYVDALPKLVDKNYRLHTTFNQDVVSTGRLSSTHPNLQNIPIRSTLGKKIRNAFIADEDNILVSADYSQFELRLAAIMAGDEDLINDFNNDIDIHTKTASDVYKIPMDQVTSNQRRNAKVINFGVLYGMSPHGLSAATGMSFIEAKKFIDDYFNLRRPIREFIEETLEKAKNEGYVTTYFGRRRPTPDVKSSNFMVREAAKRAAANMPIQGTEADLMKRAMLRTEEKLGDLGEQILQIHDSILVECPKKNADKVVEILRFEMESVAPELDIKLKVDIKTGEHWGEL
ncbi:MAG: DNA polymerase I [Candidatus Nanosynbacter sp.]|nr:DNA polymerase I [Candidatus Nanosynbacter sp.]